MDSTTVTSLGIELKLDNSRLDRHPLQFHLLRLGTVNGFVSHHLNSNQLEFCVSRGEEWDLFIECYGHTCRVLEEDSGMQGIKNREETN